jgi:hypothetical protein
MPVVDELVTILGYELSPAALATLQKFSEGMQKAERFAKMATVAVAAFATTAELWLRRVSTDAESLVRLSDITGISTESMQALGYAVDQLGGSSRNLQNDLLMLEKTMTSPIPGQFNEALVMLQVAARDASGRARPLEDVLADLAKRFEGLSRQEALQWGTKLGLSIDTIRLLQQGREGMERLKKEAVAVGAIVPDEALRNTIKFNQDIKSLWASIKAMAETIAFQFLPLLTKVLDRWKEWVRQNQEWLKLKIKDVIEGLTTGFERFWNIMTKIKAAVSPLVSKFLDWTGANRDLSNIIGTLVAGGLTGMVALLVAAYPEVILITAGVVALGLAIEDVVSWLSGSPSYIGKFFDAFKERFPGIYGFFDWLLTVLKVELPAVLDAVGLNARNLGLKLEALVKASPLYNLLKLLDIVLTKLGFGTKTSLGAKKAYEEHGSFLKYGLAGKVPTAEMPKLEYGFPMAEFPTVKLPEIRMPKIELPSVRMPEGKVTVPRMPELELPAEMTPRLRYQPQAGRAGGNVLNDNKTVNINVYGTEPHQTARIVVDYLNPKDVNTPGPFVAPAQ